MNKLTLIAALGMAAFAAGAAEVYKNDFSTLEPGKLPKGIFLYFAANPKAVPEKAAQDALRSKQSTTVVDGVNGKEIVLEDNDANSGTGFRIAMKAEGGKTYRLTVKTRPVDGRSYKGVVTQIRAMPSTTKQQLQLNEPAAGETYATTTVEVTLKSDDTMLNAFVYTLYSGDKQGAAVKEVLVEQLD